MIYCLHPTCQKPQNSEDAKFCKSCGRQLLLGERYRAIELMRHDGDRRTFLAIDERKPSQPKCLIQQFFLPGGQSSTNSQGNIIREKAAELLHKRALLLDELGRHPQIPRLLAYFPEAQYPCWVKEFIEGQDLAAEFAATGRKNETEIRSLLSDLLPVLEFIHSKNVIHKHIQPENIIRPQEANKKLALVGFASEKLTPIESVAPGQNSSRYSEYSAPELLEGEAVFASDLYSLGLTCIHLLTGKRPQQLYNSREKTFVWREHLENNPVSTEMGLLLDKMIARNVSDRYQSAAEVLKDLNKLPKFLYFDLNSLHLEQKRFLAKQALSGVIPGKNLILRSNDELKAGQEITARIYEYIRKFTQEELKKDSVTEEEMIAVWANYTREILNKMPVPPEWQQKKEKIALALDNLKFLSEDLVRQELKSIVKAILLLIFKTLSKNEKDEFINQLLKDLEKHNIRIPRNQINASKIEKIIRGNHVFPNAIESLIFQIVVNRLSQIFLIPILSFLGIQQVRDFAGVMTGSNEWGFVIITTLGGGVSALSKYRKERKKVLFIQTIFCLYSYSIK